MAVPQCSVAIFTPPPSFEGALSLNRAPCPWIHSFVYLTLSVFHEGQKGEVSYGDSVDLRSGGVPVSYIDFQLILLCPALLLWAMPDAPNSWAFLGVRGAN